MTRQRHALNMLMDTPHYRLSFPFAFAHARVRFCTRAFAFFASASLPFLFSQHHTAHANFFAFSIYTGQIFFFLSILNFLSFLFPNDEDKDLDLDLPEPLPIFFFFYLF